MEFMRIHPDIDDYIEQEFEVALESMQDTFEIELGQCTPIEHKSYDGFIPFTNGGWDVTYPVQLETVAHNSVEFGNEKVDEQLSDAVDYSYMVAMEVFIDHNRAELEELYPDLDLDDLDAVKDVISYHDLYEKNEGRLAEDLSETESANLFDNFYLQIRAMYFAADNPRNNSGTDEVYFLAGVNTDFGYGRDKYLEVVFDENVPLHALDFEKVDSILKAMLESINVK